jgi:hypothetical protein
MMTPDLINGLFELCGAAFVALHIRQIRRDKKVAGVSIPAIVFFTSWGFWNLFYYPHLEQWLSFAGGVAIVITNCVWVGYLFYYSRKPKDDFEMYFDESEWGDR